ncbi:MAG: Methyltransferase domain [Rhodobacteraceae bacterium HLUCCA12]|nr:MAG: Methyltransferase domain [Rhodobacteraceae bacterium HLUCCA12]
MSDPTHWDNWNRGGGPRYPKEKVVQFLFRRFPDRAARAGRRVLDLGCGSGVHMVFLAQEGFDAHGTDISPVGVANTHARLAEAGLSGAVAVGSVAPIDYPDGHFDALICIGVLECAGPDLLAPALAEVVRVLKPGAPALALFAAHTDFRLRDGNVLGLHGFTDAEVSDAIAPLRDRAEVWMDRHITTYENRRIEQNEHLLTLIKGKP